MNNLLILAILLALLPIGVVGLLAIFVSWQNRMMAEQNAKDWPGMWRQESQGCEVMQPERQLQLSRPQLEVRP